MELPEQDRQAFIDAARRRTQPQDGGAAFGVYPSSGKRPEKLNVSRDVNMPAQVARGWVAGTLGLPGDIEGLGRLLVNMAPAGQEHERVTGKSFVGETPVLPTSDFYREWLPGGDERPAAQFASGLGALAGGAGSTKVAGAAVKGAKAVGKTVAQKVDRKADGGLVTDTDAIAAKLKATGMDDQKAFMQALRMADARQEAHMAGGGLLKALKGAKAAAEAPKPVAGPQAKALETARQNAVKMLGLPETNTPQERAKALGFTDYLHGTQRMDRLLEKKSLDPKRATSGPMPFGTSTPELASSYAMQKADTSLRARDEGDVSKYFEVAPKDIGVKGMRTPLPVERAWYFMSPEQRAEISSLAPRVGYENLDEFTGKFIVHPEGVNATLSPDQWDWIMKREARGNPLVALRQMWHDSGQLIDEPGQLGEIYRLAGVKAPISQASAPWTEAKGVLLGKARITNPLDTSDTEQVASIIEPLKQAFAKDRTKTATGPDQWVKQSRYTPKEWVSELERDLSQGKESYVWTSIPDKVTEELKRLNFNGIIDRSGKGGGAKEPVVIPFEPAQVRSRFAAFDPARINESDLLGAADPTLLAGVAVGSGLGLDAIRRFKKEEQKPEEQKKARGGLAKRV